jgi:hypothetical protein
MDIKITISLLMYHAIFQSHVMMIDQLVTGSHVHTLFFLILQQKSQPSA